jgi:hypothetical protein
MMITPGWVERLFKGIDPEIRQANAEIRQANERLLTQKDRYIEDLKGTIKQLQNLHTGHLEDMKMNIEQLQIFIAALGVIILFLMVICFYLLGARDEQRSRLEAQNNKYEGMILEKNNRIQSLEVKQDILTTKAAESCNHHENQHQPIVYAFPGLPTPASKNC